MQIAIQLEHFQKLILLIQFKFKLSKIHFQIKLQIYFRNSYLLLLLLKRRFVIHLLQSNLKDHQTLKISL
jgi:hypothetical protein